jgi:ribonucleoside-diphosphate reductase alpha chain
MKSAASVSASTSGKGLNLNENSLKVLEKRYLKRNEEGTVIETAVDMFTRVARTIAEGDRVYGKSDAEVERTATEFYRLMTSLEFLPNSPTLMNAGRELGQLSACFVLPVGDSMDEIFESVKHAALIHKSGGGTGFSFSRIRPKNDVVKSTKGVSSGPISFMTVFDAATETVKQGGTRRGANMGILQVDHPDVLDFVTCKQQNDRLNNFNISVAMTDPFMDAVEKDGEYDLVSPRNKTVVKRLQARKVFDTIVNMAWKNGDPGIIFLDRINQYNPTPHVGKVESTNPCGEQPLLPYESCNLGSINLAKMLAPHGAAVDYEKLRHTVRQAVHFLDNVIDVNRYPIEKISEMTRANRKIGLGVMGFADMLLEMGIPYNSDEAVKLGEKVMKFITDEGRTMSEELARERGAFPNFKGSIYDDGSRPFGIRNATVTTIAPTGTLSIIAGCSSGIEPLFALTFVRKVLDGAELVEVNTVFERVAKEKGFYSNELMREIAEHGGCTGVATVPGAVQRVFVTAHDITPEWHIRMQAAFQKYTDNAVSKTVNFPHSATQKDVEKVYLLAYKTGCKGVTIYRDGSRDEQVLSTGATEKARKAAAAGQHMTVASASPELAEEKKPRHRPLLTQGVTQKIPTGCGNLYITINEDEEGICEVFSTMGKSGGCAASQSEAVSRMVSLALRSGVSIDSIIKQVKGIRCPSPAWGEGGSILSCPDAIGRALERYMKEGVNHRYQKPKAAAAPQPTVGYASSDCAKGGNKNHLGLCPECPDCGGLLEFGEGCAFCRGCGFSKCG